MSSLACVAMSSRRVGPGLREGGATRCLADRSERGDQVTALVPRLVCHPCGASSLARSEQEQERKRGEENQAAQDVDPREREHARLRADLAIEHVQRLLF